MSIPAQRYDQEIVTVFTQKLLPWWQRYGLTHLVASAPTLREFKAQPLPETIRTTVKKRRGKKIAVRGPRVFENTSFKIARWPEDGQETIRYPSLCCVLQGEADFHIADYVVHCPAGHFMLFNANVPQPDGQRSHFECEDTSQRYCEVLWLLVPPGTNNSISSWICYSQGEKHWSRRLFDYCLIERLEVLSFYNAFMREITEQPTGYREIAELSFETFLRFFARELDEGRFSHMASRSADLHGTPHSSLGAIDLALRHIDRHLNQNLTTQSVADAVYMSRSNFIRRFQQETGQPFNAYLTKRRLEEARRLLGEEILSVETVCGLVGLSPSQLRYLFQRNFNQSPSQFAALQQGRNNSGGG